MQRPLPNEPELPTESDFETRLRQLRHAWTERREVSRLVHSGNISAQLELLRRIHSWALECAAAITRVYGPSLPVSVSPRPRGENDASFVLTIADAYRLIFAVVARAGGGWRIAARSLSGLAAGAATSVGPSRRDGSWTRARVEDLILAQVASVERSRSESPSTNRILS